MLALTLDIDWAPDFMVAQVAQMVESAGVAATWFVTHTSPAVTALRRNARFELGIHPNFLPGSSHGGDFSSVLRACMEMVPDADSMRTHALVQSSPLFSQVIRETPIRTDVSLFLENCTHLMPTRFWWGGGGASLLRLPFFWEDDFAMENPHWDPAAYDPALIRQPGLRILNFHPVHIWLNSRSMAGYQMAKSANPDLRNADRSGMEPFVNGGAGIRTWLGALLRDIRESGIKTHTMREIAAAQTL